MKFADFVHLRGLTAVAAYLGLGTIATQDANAVAITGGTVAGLSTFSAGIDDNFQYATATADASDGAHTLSIGPTNSARRGLSSGIPLVIFNRDDGTAHTDIYAGSYVDSTTKYAWVEWDFALINPAFNPTGRTFFIFGAEGKLLDNGTVTDQNFYIYDAVANANLLTVTQALATWAVPNLVPDDAYGSGWNGSLQVPTKNAVYDKIESLSGIYQPLDSDLTAIAAISTTSYGRALLALANAAATTALISSFTSSLSGAAPASGGGTANFLRADGTWAAPAGGADVTAANTWTGVQQFGTIGGAVSKLAIAGSTSGKAILDAPAVAGTAVITLPGITSTLATLGANTFTALQTITQATANAGILASTGYSLTGSDQTNMIDLAGTWNTSGAPTAFKINMTRTAAGAGALLMDLQIGGTTTFAVKGGTHVGGTANVIATTTQFREESFYVFNNVASALAGTFTGTRMAMDAGQGGVYLSNAMGIAWSANANLNSFDVSTYLGWGGAATVQQGRANAASPVAQTLQAQGSRAGTDSNVGGANFTWQPGTGTGTGTAASAIISAPTVAASGTGAQTVAEICRFNTTTGVTVKSGVALQLGNAAVTGLAAGVLAATTNATVTITDSAGQVYRVPCII